jgi:hypothetical protein
MADTKISAATAVATPAQTDEYATNQGGASKKTTLTQILSGDTRVQSVNYTLPANYSLVVARSRTINSGVIMTLSSGSILRIL